MHFAEVTNTMKLSGFRFKCNLQLVPTDSDSTDSDSTGMLHFANGFKWDSDSDSPGLVNVVSDSDSDSNWNVRTCKMGFKADSDSDSNNVSMF